MRYFPIINPATTPLKCALRAIGSADPISKRSNNAKNIKASVILIGKTIKYIRICGARTARQANIPNKAPLAPTTEAIGLLKTNNMKNDHNEYPIEAIIPERKNTARNLFPPILRSSSGPMKNKNIILNRRCHGPPCRKIFVTRFNVNFHGEYIISDGERARNSEYPGIYCRKKDMMAITRIARE
ncbi:MAG TPA: hypothetical protein VIO58_15610 [Candidatus Methanoperedens sp.]